MSATSELLQDHIFIRRLQAVIERCYTILYENKDVPAGDLIKIADMMEQFIDHFHHVKEESTYFPKTEHHDAEEVRKFVIEHEFGRRIAKRVKIHLEEFLEGKNREPLARYLKTYSVFILDHTSKEDRFFNSVKEKQSLAKNEEQDLKREFDRMKHECMQKNGDLIQLLLDLENADWVRQNT